MAQLSKLNQNEYLLSGDVIGTSGVLPTSDAFMADLSLNLTSSAAELNILDGATATTQDITDLVDLKINADSMRIQHITVDHIIGTSTGSDAVMQFIFPLPGTITKIDAYSRTTETHSQDFDISDESDNLLGTFGSGAYTAYELADPLEPTEYNHFDVGDMIQFSGAKLVYILHFIVDDPEET